MHAENVAGTNEGGSALEIAKVLPANASLEFASVRRINECCLNSTQQAALPLPKI